MDQVRQLLNHPLAANGIMIGVELLVVVIVFWIVGRLLARRVDSLASLSIFKGYDGAADALRAKVRLLVTLVCLLACAAVAGGNGYLVYRGEYLPTYTVETVRGLPREFWIELGLGAGKVIGLVFATAIVLRTLRRPLTSLCERAKAYEGIQTNDEALVAFFGGLERGLTRTAWLATLAAAAFFLHAPDAIVQALVLVVKVYAIFAAGLSLWRGLAGAVESLEALSEKYSESKGFLGYYNQLKVLVPVLRRTLEYLIYLGTATIIAYQVDTLIAFAEWGPRLMRVLGIVFVSRVVVEVARLLVFEILVTRSSLDEEQKQRRLTVVPLIQSSLKYLIYFGAMILVLKEVGIDPLPILAGAGIIGLAVGLGAQNVVNDVLSGFFILFENYYLVGDVVRLGDAEGTVEAIDIRTTRIRDSAGRLHIIRNGNVGDVINYSKGYTSAVVQVGVGYDSDLDEVYATIEELGRGLAESNPDVLAPTVVHGLDGFGESDLVIQTSTRVRPGQHKPVERALRKLIKAAFEERGIDIPYARRVLIIQNPEEAAPLLAATS